MAAILDVKLLPKSSRDRKRPGKAIIRRDGDFVSFSKRPSFNSTPAPRFDPSPTRAFRPCATANLDLPRNSLFDGTCYSDNRSNSRANTCNKPRLPEGTHLLDKRPPPTSPDSLTSPSTAASRFRNFSAARFGPLPTQASRSCARKCRIRLGPSPIHPSPKARAVETPAERRRPDCGGQRAPSGATRRTLQ
ncbi:Hypothetical predicted protein [Olea europaea subsp. europaea]|uniref:Uncharacterized protein n=1 Tax=Olea europaea subsp. europaea TaxID=158383 RepID=A0A8S0UEC2_OLEEU|nr:Hypothetical predicted protein [Olea europaea subsp. europaea]